MAEACVLQWVPETLYNSAISSIVTHYPRFKRDVKVLPENVLFDIFCKLYDKGRLCDLAAELSDLDVFSQVLRVNDKRLLLHRCFQVVQDHGQRASTLLADCYSHECSIVDASDRDLRDRFIHRGLSLGGFLCEAGWLYDAEKVFGACLQLCYLGTDQTSCCQALECCCRLLHVRNMNCKYTESERIWKEAQTIMQKLENYGCTVNHAAIYAEYCALLFARSQYVEAYKYCFAALKELNLSLQPRVIVDVFRLCSKACVVKREFRKAEVLIKYAVQFARDHFGLKHHRYSDALLEYGFYLLNVDYISQAVQVYQTALDIRMAVFGGNNLNVAIAHEDLAYSMYVNEYSSGRFQDAKDHAESAIEIINKIVPKDHLLLASSKRVKALILEEIAIDSHNKELEERLLHEAQDLHLASLSLALRAFGENNVQTAKHYGNLGRLYQSMRRYSDAEEMHLKAIEIKERLLGPEDYEVALSVGHLASLYNYDMQKYMEAAHLYQRSIAIGQKLFGPGYSGLEYDYRGLLRLYHTVGDVIKAQEYSIVLEEWIQIRDRSNSREKRPLEFEMGDNIGEILQGVLSKDCDLPGSAAT